MASLISIIIPIYNSDKYLVSCLDSILEQSYVEWECIMVDDGSTDLSGNICKKYVSFDPRFKYYHKENGGVSSARNMGLDKATGDWVLFVDADDTMPNDGLCILYGIASNGYDIVFGGYSILREDGVVLQNARFNRSDTLSVIDAMKELYTPSDCSYQGYIWCKLFCRQLIETEKVKFDEKIYFNEDRLFIMRCLSCCNTKIGYTTSVVYNYVQRSTGAMGSLTNALNPLFATDIVAMSKMLDLVSNYTQDDNLMMMAVNGMYASYNMVCQQMVINHKYNEEMYRIVKSEMNRVGLSKSYKYSLIKQSFALLLRAFFPKCELKRLIRK